jgi:hypothetical protein
MRPIKDVVNEERAIARQRHEELAKREAALAERERGVRALMDQSKSREDAIGRRQEWATACTAARRNSMGAIRAIAGLLRAALSHADRIRAKLEKAKDLDPFAAVRLIKELTSAARQANEALHIALQTEHLAIGAPTEIVGLQDMGMSLEEAVSEIEEAKAALARAQRAGLALPPGAALPPLDAQDDPLAEAAETAAQQEAGGQEGTTPLDDSTSSSGVAADEGDRSRKAPGSSAGSVVPPRPKSATDLGAVSATQAATVADADAHQISLLSDAEAATDV